MMKQAQFCNVPSPLHYSLDLNFGLYGDRNSKHMVLTDGSFDKCTS